MEIIPFEEDQKDIFQIDATTKRDSVSLKGTDGIMLAACLSYVSDVKLIKRRYLKYYCNNTMSWGGETEGDNIRIPNPLPVVEKTWRQKV